MDRMVSRCLGNAVNYNGRYLLKHRRDHQEKQKSSNNNIYRVCASVRLLAIFQLSAKHIYYSFNSLLHPTVPTIFLSSNVTDSHIWKFEWKINSTKNQHHLTWPYTLDPFLKQKKKEQLIFSTQNFKEFISIIIIEIFRWWFVCNYTFSYPRIIHIYIIYYLIITTNQFENVSKATDIRWVSVYKIAWTKLIKGTKNKKIKKFIN